MKDHRSVDQVLEAWGADLRPFTEDLTEGKMDEGYLDLKALAAAQVILRSIDGHVENACSAIQEYMDDNPIVSAEKRLSELMAASGKIASDGKRLRDQAEKAFAEFQKKAGDAKLAGQLREDLDENKTVASSYLMSADRQLDDTLRSLKREDQTPEVKEATRVIEGLQRQLADAQKKISGNR